MTKATKAHLLTKVELIAANETLQRRMRHLEQRIESQKSDLTYLKTERRLANVGRSKWNQGREQLLLQMLREANGALYSWKGSAERYLLMNRKLREALAAYRSALRSGEPETDKLRTLGDEALR